MSLGHTRVHNYDGNPVRIFVGNAHRELGYAVCRHLGVNPGRIDIQRFPDTETKVRILDDVRGIDAFIIQPTSPPVNENLMDLLIIVDALRRASARSITVVIPYFGYARQDRKHEGRVPITAKLVANLLAASGVNRVLCLDLHAAQIQGFFDIPMDHLFSTPVLIDYLKALKLEKCVVMSPDVGSIKMADRYAKRLGCGIAVVEKRRISDENVETGYVIGEIRDRDVVIVDDMITSAGSMAAAVKAAREAGARTVRAMATHGLFVSNAFERMIESGATEVIVTDTVPPQSNVPPEMNLTVISVANLLGDAIGRIHRNKSISLLFV
ncbi:MAG: ribose-phosphate pyrophosphokinase [Planctomycetota bacterium]|jgi:ribose-phosphate pyrophosphokinase|nr:ribose-phosphate pyrophosphokinase [Planctomycetota bacterium]